MPKGVYGRKTPTICSHCELNPRDGRSSWCRKCRTMINRIEWQHWTHERKREKWLKHKYNITYKQYEDMYIAQDKKCAICKCDIYIDKRDNSHTTACIDHCHKTGRIRGLLCNHCNRALGLLKEDKNIIRNMEKYIG